MMKKSRGFTIIELIAVLTILAVILAITVPAITGVIKTAKEKACILDADVMEKAAKTYVQIEGIDIKQGNSKTISLESLKSSNYISEVVDPEDQKTPCDGYVIVTNTNGDYTYHAALKCSNTCRSADYNDDLSKNTLPSDLDTVEKNGDQYFEGANPNNWVKFGRMDQNDKHGIMWRMIKIDGTGIKMVYEGIENGGLKPLEDGRALIDGSMGVPWDKTGNNKWNAPVSLVGKLDTWLSNIYISNLTDYVSSANWKVGGVPYQAPTNLRTFLTYQDIDSTNTGGNFSGLTNYKSVIGTINAVDFMYTSDNDECSYSYRETGSNNECAYNTDGSLNNFLQKDRYHYWTLNARSDSSDKAWNITNSGLIGSNLTYLSAVSVRPVLNLKLDTEFLAGTGTIEDPYILEPYMTNIWDSPLITLKGDSTVYIRQYDQYIDQGATAYDEEDGDITNKIITTGTLDINTPGQYKIEYNVTDSDNNKAMPVTRTVVVVERDRPLITLIGANPTYVTITGTYEELGATAYDINYGDISSAIVTSGTVDTNTLGTYYITYNVTNQDGIKAPEVTRKVIVKVPTPTIELKGPNPTLVDIGTPYTEMGATATDAVDGDLTSSIVKSIERYNPLGQWENASSIDTSKIATFRIKYSVTNSYGVNALVYRTVNIVRADGPTITYTPDGDSSSKKIHSTVIDVNKTKYNVDANSLKYFIYNSYSSFDYQNIENYFRTSFQDNDTITITTGTGYYYIYAIAKDIYGNTRMKSSQSFRMDNSAPEIEMRSGISRILLGKEYKDPGATAYDKYFDGNLTSKIITTSNVDTSKEGIYFVTYEVTDSAGNKTTVKRRIEVYHPSPIIYLNGGSNISLLYGTPYVELGATATDEIDGDLTSSIIISGTVNHMKEGVYEITYSVTNSSGHTTTRIRTVDVYIPNPVITITGSNPARVVIHSSYTDAGATATDVLDGNLTSRLITTGTVNVDVAGTYYISYSVTNNLNKNTTVKRSVIVYVPTPKITILGNNPYSLFKSQSYSDAGATAMDELDGDLTSKIETTGTVNTNVAGTYPITYTVTNSEGGVGKAIRNVVVKKSMITITLAGSRSITQLRGTAFTEPGYTATDELDGDITNKVSVTSNLNPNIAGTYYITYTVTNSGGDTKTETRTIILEKPELKIDLLGDPLVTILRGGSYSEAGYTATDEIDGDITNKVVVTSNLNPNIAGTYYVTYTVTNSGGDTTTVKRTVVVRKPLLDIVLVGSTTVEMLKGGTYTEPGYTATDEVDGDLTSKVTLLSNLNPTTTGRYTIEYRVVNSGGDIKAVIRYIVVRDPKVTLTLNGSSTVELPIGSVYSDAGSTATDELLGDVSNKIISTPNINPNILGVYYVDYEVTSSGVKATAKRTVKVVALPGPIIAFNPNGDSTYRKENQTVVTITKGERDVDNTSYRYVWKTDLTIPPESEFKTLLNSGDVIKTPADVTGRYYLFVLAKDIYGNTSILGSNGFSIDNTAPVITLNGSKVVEVPVDGTYTEPGANVVDNDSGLNATGLVVTSNVVPGVIGTYQVTYTATDKVGNTATEVRTVSVIEAALKDAPSEDFVPLYDASYFIGSSAANWVEFGNAADNTYDYIPIMWRIIKADASGVKVIYEGVKDSNNTIQNGTIGKRVWDTTNNTWNRPSTIRTVLNDFYTNLNEENKNTLTKKINWCVGKVHSPYALDNFKSDECTLLGNELTSIGLASAGDYILTSKDPCSGYNQASCGTNNFLKKNYSYFTLSTDIASNVATFVINSSGGISRDEVTKSLDIRPVINLRPDVLILSGEGTFDNPYKLNSRIPVVDNTPPVVTFDPTSATGKLSDRNVEVVVTDDITGVNAESLKYVWTTSSTEPSTSDIITGFVNGSKIEVPTSITGNYYLWVIAKDRKGNQTIASAGPYMVDNEPPVITLHGDAITKFPVGSVYTDPGATAIDNMDGDITSKIKVTSNVVPSVPGSYSVTYDVSDTAGNKATQVVRLVVVNEITPPVVTFNPNGNSTYTKTVSSKVTVTDNDKVDDSSLKYLWSTSSATPSEGSFTNSFTNGSSLAGPTNVNGNYYLWIIAKDVTGNVTIISSNIFHIDSIAPTIKLTGGAKVTVFLNDTYNDAGATATDAIDGDITSKIVKTSNVNMAVVGNYTVTYNVTDTAGNAATQVTRIVQVAQMQTTSFTFTNASATGRNGPTQTQVNTAYLGGPLEGTVISQNGIQYWTVPATGRYRIEASGAKGGGPYGGKGATMRGDYMLQQGTVLKIIVGQIGTSGSSGHGGGGGTFVLKEDGTPLVIAGGGGGASANANNSTGKTTQDGTPGSSSYATGGTPTGGSDGQGYNYGCNGNGLGFNNILLKNGMVSTPTYIAGGFGGGGDGRDSWYSGSYFANQGGGGGYSGGSASVTYTNSGSNPPASAAGGAGSYNNGTYQLNTAGVNTTMGKAIVTYVLDVQSPVIILTGNASVRIPAGSVYNDAGATATDDFDGNITSRIVVVSNIKPNIPGVYTVTYNVSDDAGNQATEVTRTVTVYETVPPTIVFGTNGNSGYVKSASTTVTVTDNEAVDSSTLKYQWTTSTTQPTEASFTTTFTNGSAISTPAGVTGMYYLWVLAKDMNANVAISRTNAFSIDNIAPVITLTGNKYVTTAIDSVYSDLGATATDNIQGDMTSLIITVSNVNTSIKGAYKVTYDVTDNAGNAATEVVRNVLVGIDTVYNYVYTGSAQSFAVPFTGSYKLEVWGAGPSGKGGYSTGKISLTEGDTLWAFVGGINGYNGGVNANGNISGGATDMRLLSGLWNDANGLNSRIIVAGGGGAYPGGSGGTAGVGGGTAGTAGGNGVEGGGGFGGSAGTQTSGGSGGSGYCYSGSSGAFGKGGTGGGTSGYCSGSLGGNGGGGWYGGGGGGSNYSYYYYRSPGGGGGGSGYVLTSSSSKPTGYNPASKYYMTNTQTIAGNSTMPNPAGGTMTGRSGDGYARITLIFE